MLRPIYVLSYLSFKKYKLIMILTGFAHFHNHHTVPVPALCSLVKESSKKNLVLKLTYLDQKRNFRFFWF